MGKKGKPVNPLVPTTVILLSPRAKQLLGQHPEFNLSKAVDLMILNTFGNPEDLELYKLDEQIKELEDDTKGLEELIKQKEAKEMQLQTLKALRDQKIKEREEKKQKEMDGLNFAVFVLRKAIHNAVKSNMKLYKEQFFNELGIEFDYEIFNKDFYKDYGKILELTSEEMIQRYNIKFTESKVSNKEAYEKYYNEYKGVKTNNSESVKEIGSNNNERTEISNTTNNLSDSSNTNETPEVENEAKESEPNNDNIENPNEIDTENKKSEVNFKPDNEFVLKEQENEQINDKYIPTEQLIKINNKENKKITNSKPIFENGETAYQDFINNGIKDLISAKNSDGSVTYYWPSILTDPTFDIIYFKINKNWNDLKPEQKIYLAHVGTVIKNGNITEVYVKVKKKVN